MKTACITLFVLAPAYAAGPFVTPTPATVGQDVVSTARSEYNYQQAIHEDVAVFARADADFANGKIVFVSPEGQREIGFSDPQFKDSDPWLSPDGRDLYFITNRQPIAGEAPTPDDYDIWHTRRVAGAWLAPTVVENVNSSAGEFGPQVHGDYLYFSSTRSGKNKLYRSRLVDGRPEKPERLEGPFDGAVTDSDLTFSRDQSTAIWCSSRPGGAGKCDLYLSRRGPSGWTEAENLGGLVNGPDMEYSAMLSPNGARLFFASNRPVDGQESGASDIYAVATRDVPVLRDAITTPLKEKLLEAFGGRERLQSINTIEFTLTVSGSDSDAPPTTYYYDFGKRSVSDVTSTKGIVKTRFVRGDRGVEQHGDNTAPIREDDRDRLLRGLELNFLTYLRHPELRLEGPIDIREEGDLHWYRLVTPEGQSPVVGLDPLTGRIVRVGTGQDLPTRS